MTMGTCTAVIGAVTAGWGTYNVGASTYNELQTGGPVRQMINASSADEAFEIGMNTSEQVMFDSIQFSGGVVQVVGGASMVKGGMAMNEANVNQTSTAVLNDGYYEVNGLKFSEYYYEKLWSSGRGAPSLTANEIIANSSPIGQDSMPGFYQYEYGGWELVYNPVTKEVWHLQPVD